MWWKDHGNHIEFLDGPEEDDAKQEGPPLHHFRAYNLKMEEDYLKECWERCIDQNITMPIENVRVYNSKGDLVSMRMAHPSENIQQPEHSLLHQLPHTKDPPFSETGNCYTPLTQDQPALATGTPVHCVKDHDSLGHQPTQVHNHLESELSLTEDAHDLQAEDNHDQESEDESEVVDVRELTDDFVPESLTSQYNPLTHLGKQVNMLLIGDRQLTKKFDKLRAALKTAATTQTRQRYERVAQNVKENLISQFKECNTRVIEWEKSFIATHGTYPDPEDIPGAVAIAMRKRK